MIVCCAKRIHIILTQRLNTCRKPVVVLPPLAPLIFSSTLYFLGISLYTWATSTPNNWSSLLSSSNLLSCKSQMVLNNDFPRGGFTGQGPLRSPSQNLLQNKILVFRFSSCSSFSPCSSNLYMNLGSTIRFSISSTSYGKRAHAYAESNFSSGVHTLTMKFFRLSLLST